MDKKGGQGQGRLSRVSVCVRKSAGVSMHVCGMCVCVPVLARWHFLPVIVCYITCKNLKLLCEERTDTVCLFPCASNSTISGDVSYIDPRLLHAPRSSEFARPAEKVADDGSIVRQLKQVHHSASTGDMVLEGVSLEGRVAIVTGASSGIGQCCL